VGSAAKGRGEQTRVRILDSAVRRFGERGYRETSLSAVARDVGITPAAVYAYYPDKEGLFVAALDHDADAWLDGVLQAQGPGLRAWVGFLQRLLDSLDAHPLALRVLAGQEADMLARVLDLPSARQLRERLAESIRQGQKQRVVRRDIDAGAIAEGLATMVESTLIAAVQTRASGAFADVARRTGVSELVSAALLPRGLTSSSARTSGHTPNASADPASGATTNSQR
jgi:AcrR family transcriptional regulator